MEMKEKDLVSLKEKINKAKEEIAELQGERKHLLKQLKDNWGCNTVEEAEVKIKEMTEEKEDLEEKIQKGLKTLEGYFQGEKL